MNIQPKKYFDMQPTGGGMIGEKKRYWWVLFDYSMTGGSETNARVIVGHPFSFAKASNVFLLNWKEITKEEYDMF